MHKKVMSGALQVCFLVLYAYVGVAHVSFVIPQQDYHGVRAYHYNREYEDDKFDNHKGQRVVNLSTLNHKGNDLDHYNDNFNFGYHKIRHENQWGQNYRLDQQKLGHKDDLDQLKYFSNFNLDENHQDVDSRKYNFFHPLSLRHPKHHFYHNLVFQKNHPDVNSRQQYLRNVDQCQYQQDNLGQGDIKNYKSGNLHYNIDNDLSNLVDQFIYYILKESLNSNLKNHYGHKNQQDIFSHLTDQSNQDSGSFDHNKNARSLGHQKQHILDYQKRLEFHKNQQDYNLDNYKSQQDLHSHHRKAQQRYNLGHQNQQKRYIEPQKKQYNSYYQPDDYYPVQQKGLRGHNSNDESDEHEYNRGHQNSKKKYDSDYLGGQRQHNLNYQGDQQEYNLARHGNQQKLNSGHQKDQQNYNSLHQRDHSSDQKYQERHNLHNLKPQSIPNKMYDSEYYDYLQRHYLGYQKGDNLIHQKEHQKYNPEHQGYQQAAHSVYQEVQGEHTSNGDKEQQGLNQGDLFNHQKDLQDFPSGHQEDQKIRKINNQRKTQRLNSGYQGHQQNVYSSQQEYSSGQNENSHKHNLDHQQSKEIIFQHRDHLDDKDQPVQTVIQNKLGKKSGYQDNQHVNNLGLQEVQQGAITGDQEDQQKYNSGHRNQQYNKSGLRQEQQEYNSGLDYYQKANNTDQDKYNSVIQKNQHEHYSRQQKTHYGENLSKQDQQGHALGHEEKHKPSVQEYHQRRYNSSYQNDQKFNSVANRDQQGHNPSIQGNQEEKLGYLIYQQVNDIQNTENKHKYNSSHQKEQQGYISDQQIFKSNQNADQQENQQGYKSSNRDDQQEYKSGKPIYSQGNSYGHQEHRQRYNLSHYGDSNKNNSDYQGRHTPRHQVLDVQGQNSTNQDYHQHENNSSHYKNQNLNSGDEGILQGYNSGYKENQKIYKSDSQSYQQKNNTKNKKGGLQEYNQQGYNSSHQNNEQSQQSGLNKDEKNHNSQQIRQDYNIQGSGRQENQQGSSTTSSGPVTVTSMGVIYGSWMSSRRGRKYEAYRGVRYAESPVGELRFQPPKPVELYSGEVDASEEGPACPAPPTGTVLLDEDCLRLNVYTPLVNRSGLLPVIVFIHPGGFYSMSGRSDILGPEYLMDRDVVLVTFNYRLASLGFLATGDKWAPGNNGLKDQVVVLQWVQRNIIAFGGDANLVTIAGYGSGSISVALHMISPMSKGLFHHAISMSGSPTSKVRSPSELHSLAVKQAQLVGCPYNSSKIIIDCLKTKSWKEIGNSLTGFFEIGCDPIELWVPIVEPDFGQERFLTMEPMDAIREGKMHAVPYIVSQTEKEFYWLAINVFNNATLLSRMLKEWETLAPISFVLPKENSSYAVKRLTQAYMGGNFTNDTKSENGLGRLYGDSLIGFSVHRLANLMCRHSPQPVYYSQFNYSGNHSNWEDPVTGKPIGAMHYDDLIYLFSQNYRFPDIRDSSLDLSISERMTAIFYNFAKYGDPNPRGDLPELANLSWPQMKPEDRKYLRIENQFSVGTKMLEDRLQVWEEIYPIQY